MHEEAVEELTTSFDGRELGSTVSIRNAMEATPAPERMLLGGREAYPQQPQQRPLSSLDNTFTHTVKLKLPPSPAPGMSSSSTNRELAHCTLPRTRVHKEVTFNPQATFQVSFFTVTHSVVINNK